METTTTATPSKSAPALSPETVNELSSRDLQAVPKTQIAELLNELHATRSLKNDAVAVIQHFVGLLPLDANGGINIAAAMGKLPALLSSGADAFPQHIQEAMARIKADMQA